MSCHSFRIVIGIVILYLSTLPTNVGVHHVNMTIQSDSKQNWTQHVEIYVWE